METFCSLDLVGQEVIDTEWLNSEVKSRAQLKMPLSVNKMIAISVSKYCTLQNYNVTYYVRSSEHSYNPIELLNPASLHTIRLALVVSLLLKTY